MLLESRQKMLDEMQICSGCEAEYADYKLTTFNNYNGPLSDCLRLFASDSYKVAGAQPFYDSYYLIFSNYWYPVISTTNYSKSSNSVLLKLDHTISKEQWANMSLLDIFDITVSAQKSDKYKWNNLKTIPQNRFTMYTELQKKYIMTNPINHAWAMFIADLDDKNELLAMDTVVKPYVVYSAYKSLSPVKMYREDLFIRLIKELPYEEYKVITSGDAAALVYYNSSNHVKTYMNLFAFFLIFGNGVISSTTLFNNDKKYAGSFGKIIYDSSVDYYSQINSELLKYYHNYKELV